MSIFREHPQKHDFELHFGNYRLFHIVKRGSISTIYRGEHARLGSPVIVKVLNSWSATEEHVRQFCAEARLHASLRHANIVRILDFGMRGQIPFIVMDYAPRGTLEDNLSACKPLPVMTIAPLVRSIASALQYIHDHKLIHRDVKAQNILLGSCGEVWLSDFGIAVAVQPWNQQFVQQSVGTAQYVAPEQVDGYPLTASDQYALAVQVYMWLAGRPPFVGTSVQLCQQHLQSAPPRLCDIVPALPRCVEAVVMRGMAKDPYQRYTRVQDFANALWECALESEARIRAYAMTFAPSIRDVQERLYAPEMTF